MSAKSHLRVPNIEVSIHAIPREVGVHAGLPINEVFGLAGTIKDRDLNPHALLYASAMVLTTTIGVITSVVEVVATVVMMG